MIGPSLRTVITLLLALATLTPHLGAQAQSVDRAPVLLVQAENAISREGRTVVLQRTPGGDPVDVLVFYAPATPTAIDEAIAVVLAARRRDGLNPPVAQELALRPGNGRRGVLRYPWVARVSRDLARAAEGRVNGFDRTLRTITVWLPSS